MAHELSKLKHYCLLIAFSSLRLQKRTTLLGFSIRIFFDISKMKSENIFHNKELTLPSKKEEDMFTSQKSRKASFLLLEKTIGIIRQSN